ncbi:MAG: hypothetical protein ACU0CB_00135, partial [Roseovarius sp.]
AGAAAAVQADQAGGQSKGGYSPCRPRRVRERGEEMLFFINLILNIKNAFCVTEHPGRTWFSIIRLTL